MRRRLAAGNWKMNGVAATLAEVEALIAAHPSPAVDILLCPPATLIADMVRRKGGHPLLVGGQDAHQEAAGARTGSISAAQLKDVGATHVILGHSERRTDHRETDEQILAKARAAHAAGLTAVICLGETAAEREAGEALAVIARQFDGSVPEDATAENTVIAYEPVWAIGSGVTPTDEQIAEVHGALRNRAGARFGTQGAGMRLLYGGSVKASNAAAIFAIPDVDGALVGGASLRASDFSPIVAALEAAERMASADT